MKNDPADLLERAKAEIVRKLSIETVKAEKLKTEMDSHLLIAAELRRQVESIEYSIRSLRGGQLLNETTDDSLETAIVGILATNEPLSYAEIVKRVEERGMAGGGVRKALRGIAFKMIGHDPARYTLRDRSEVAGVG